MREALAVLLTSTLIVLAFFFGKSEGAQAKLDLKAAESNLASVNTELEAVRAENLKLKDSLFAEESKQANTQHKLTLCQLEHIGNFIGEQCCKLLKEKTSNAPTPP